MMQLISSYSRFLKPRLVEACEDTPVIFLRGARQVGKSTLMKELVKDLGGNAFSLDDPSLVSLARSDPLGFIDQLKRPVLIDEIQRAPEIMLPIKLRVDENRQPGQFLLTGSADYHTLPKVAESMAGRMEIRTLWPLSQGELGRTPETFLEQLFTRSWPAQFPSLARTDLYTKVITGGYPEALHRSKVGRRSLWFADYLGALIQKDLRELSAIDGIEQIPNLLEVLAARAANLFNAADASRVLGLNQTSTKRYLSLLTSLFVIFKLRPWFSNTDKRLAKTPKVYFSDTGLLAHLLRLKPEWEMSQGSRFGAVLENFIVTEILKQCSWSPSRFEAYHFRTLNGQEVDLVLKNDQGHIAGIEIKASSTVSPKDFKGLFTLQDIAKDSFVGGVVLYTGDTAIPFKNNFWAVPIQALWM